MAARKGAKTGAKKSASRASSKQKSENVVPPTRATGAESATGTAIREQEREDVPQGADRGSQVEIVGGEPEPDLLEGAKPRGKQAEAAQFTSNGSLEPGMIGSPSGPVPISTQATSQEHAEELEEKVTTAQQVIIERRQTGKRLSDEELSRMGRAELQAVGAQRGYELQEAGSRTTRAAFARAQDTDENLIDNEE